MTTDSPRTSAQPVSLAWPLFILVGSILIWAGYQDYAVNSQRSLYHAQFEAALPAINQAQGVQTRYVNLMKDLIATSAKDPAAANIVKAAEAAHLIHITNSTNSAPAAPAPPAPAQ